ncbi:MAG: AraC family transcriptional regulator [Clostridia bacterium]|nr:AraC family transcriptional regulator [Clostridia bacterium]
MKYKILDLNDSEAPIHAYIHFQGINYDQEMTLVQCGHQKTTPAYGYGPMIRDHYLIHFIQTGKGKLNLHNRIFTITEQHCFLIYPHQIAYYESDEADPWDYYWIGLSGYDVERVLEQAGFTYNRFILPLISAEQLFQTLQQMVTSITDPEIDLLLNGLLRIALHYLVRNKEWIQSDFTVEAIDDPKLASCQTNMDDEYVRIITSIIQTSYMQNIQIEEIANRMGLNRSYLTSIFKKHTGKSIRSYLSEFRIEQACILLKDKRRSIESIAHETGFNDPLYFSRAFKNIKGYSPSEYRKVF